MAEIKISLRHVYFGIGPGHDQEFSEFIEPIEGETVDEIVRRVFRANIHRKEFYCDRLEIQLIRPKEVRG